MEFAGPGNIGDHMVAYRSRLFNEENAANYDNMVHESIQFDNEILIKKIAIQVLLALHYMEGKGIVHLNIVPKNILVKRYSRRNSEGPLEDEV